MLLTIDGRTLGARAAGEGVEVAAKVQLKLARWLAAMTYKAFTIYDFYSEMNEDKRQPKDACRERERMRGSWRVKVGPDPGWQTSGVQH